MNTVPSPAMAPGQTAPASQAVDLSRYGRAALRWWPVVAALTLLGLLGGLIASEAGERTFTSSAVVQVNPGVVSSADGGSGNSAPNMDTEQQIALSSVVVAEAVKHVPGSLSVDEFQDRASAFSPKKASTLTLTFKGVDATQAQAGANALAEAYLQHRGAQSQADIDRARKQIQDSSKSLSAALAKAQQAANASKAGTADAARLEATAAALNDQLTPVRAQLDRINGVVVNPGVQIGTAQLPTKSDGLPRSIFLFVGAAVGLLLGLVLVLAVDAITDRVRGRRDLTRVTTAPVWAQAGARDRSVPAGALAAVAARVILLRREDGLSTLALASVSTPVAGLAGELASALHAQGVPATVVDSAAWRVDDVRPDLVTIVATGPVELDARAAATAGLCDGTLLVVSRRDQARTARAALQTLVGARAQVSGLFLDLRRRPVDGARSARSLPATGAEVPSEVTVPAEPARVVENLTR